MSEEKRMCKNHPGREAFVADVCYECLENSYAASAAHTEALKLDQPTPAEAAPTVECFHCKGKGRNPIRPYENCPICKGSGTQLAEAAPSMITTVEDEYARANFEGGQWPTSPDNSAIKHWKERAQKAESENDRISQQLTATKDKLATALRKANDWKAVFAKDKEVYVPQAPDFYLNYKALSELLFDQIGRCLDDISKSDNPGSPPA